MLLHSVKAIAPDRSHAADDMLVPKSSGLDRTVAGWNRHQSIFTGQCKRVSPAEGQGDAGDLDGPTLVRRM